MATAQACGGGGGRLEEDRGVASTLHPAAWPRGLQEQANSPQQFWKPGRSVNARLGVQSCTCRTPHLEAGMRRVPVALGGGGVPGGQDPLLPSCLRTASSGLAPPLRHGPASSRSAPRVPPLQGEN